MNWNVFALMFDAVGPPVIGATNAIVAALQGWVRLVLVGGTTLYVAGRMIWAALKGGTQHPMGDVLAVIVSANIFIYAATEAAGLGPQARDLLLTGLSNELGRAVNNAVGVQALNAPLFDQLWARMWGRGLQVYINLPWSMRGVGLTIVVVIYWIVGTLCIALAFFIWLTSFMMLALMVGFWPLGVGLFIFPWTRGLAWGWWRNTIAGVLLQVMIVALLAVLIGALNRVLQQAAANSQNEFAQIGALLIGGVIIGFLAWVAKQLPGLASSWAHGFTGFGQTQLFRLPRLDGPPSTQGGSGGAQPGHLPDEGRVWPPAPTLPSPVPRSAPPSRSIG